MTEKNAKKTAKTKSGSPQASGRSIIVDIRGRQITVLDGDTVKRKIRKFSHGRKHFLTHDGNFTVYKKDATHKSSKYPPPHGGAPMPYAVFFDGGRAFHEGDVNVASHGCIHLSPEDAKWLFSWVGDTRSSRGRVTVKVTGTFADPRVPQKQEHHADHRQPNAAAAAGAPAH